MPPEQAIDLAKVRNALKAARGIKEVQGARSFFEVSEELALHLLLVVHVLAAFYAPIQDCDEVYNFWEPTHYLNHRYGMQTWEFSPVYSIRSWFYAGLHAVVVYIASWLPFVRSKSAEFYILRIVFAFIAARFETRLFKASSQCMNPRIGFFFLSVLASSAGMFHAAISYLPSSFAMYTVTYALSEFMNWRGGIRTASGLMWLAIGTIVGWPFVAVLAVPFVVEELAMSSISGDVVDMMRRLFNALIRSLSVLALVTAVDTFFYHKLTFVCWNIVRYNVFSGGSKGPDIYGTEPWHFYIRNLLINFNFWFPLACLVWPLLLFQHFVIRRAASRMTYIRTLVFTSPFYLWLAIFTVQPHKEERFMYPIYPCLALNAAVSLHILIFNISTSDPTTLAGKIPTRLKLLATTTFVLTSVALGIWRAAGLATAYAAPLSIYAPLRAPNMTRPDTTTVCLGKEWHRFPSSYHLPPGVHLKFIRSDFHGLLPGAFSEASGFGFFPGAWLVPGGMNDENREDPSKYTDEARCTYLVDSHFPGQAPSALEPDRVHDAARWERVMCLPFLDAARTGILGRLFWVPEWSVVPERFRRRWGEYCLLKQKTVR